MTKQTYQGSCQCGRVAFEAAIDFSPGTTKCNCTSCWKKRWWSVRCAPADFHPLSGDSELIKDGAAAAPGQGGFCKHCGVTTYGFVPQTEWNPTAYYSINVAVLDNVEPEVLINAPVQYCDGRANNWWNPPAEVRHL